MDEHLGRTSAMAILAALAIAALAGLFAWGPALPTARALADTRTLLGVPNAMNVLVGLPGLLFGWWGWRATRRSRWPDALRRAWSMFQAAGVATVVLASAYHLHDSTLLNVASLAALTTACMLLTCAFLAERVHAGFASGRALTVALLVAVGAAMPALAGVLAGREPDLRALHWLQLVPILLVPAGALGLRGRFTDRSDWIVTLGLYALAQLCNLADARFFEWIGISGHTLYHLGLGVVTAWVGYVVGRVPPATVEPETPSQPHTALNTSG